MGAYDDIKEHALLCISILECKSYSNSNFEDLKERIDCNAHIILELNDYINDVDERVIILEAEA